MMAWDINGLGAGALGLRAAVRVAIFDDLVRFRERDLE
jgi:hypothetical protein